MGVSRRLAWLTKGLVFVLGFHWSVSFATEPGRGRHPEPSTAGRAIYQQYCASCHGARGEGAEAWRQPNAQGEMPAPPHDADGHTWKHSDAMLYRMVSDGWRDPFNKTKQLTMPAFREQLTPEQIVEVIAYLKTLWTPEQREFQEEETRARGAFPPQARR